MKNKTEKHLFALHYADLPPQIFLKTDTKIVLTEPELITRIVSVLRLTSQDHLILFTQTYSCLTQISSIEKKKVVVIVINCALNQLQPELTVLLPILKREALETAIDSLAQIGVSNIQLIITEKTHRSLQNVKEFDRLERLIIAAAEQSKNFSYPILHSPVDFYDYFKNHKNEHKKNIFLDAHGQSCKEVFAQLNSQQPISLLIGPEGDLTGKEKEFLKTLDYTFMSLTKSILRAEQAIALAAGIVRSFTR